MMMGGRFRETEVTAYPLRGSHSGRLFLPACMPVFDFTGL